MENRSRVVNNRTNRTNKTNKAAEYQYGSAVRKLQAVPEVRTYEPKRRDEEREQERRLRRREIRRNNRVKLPHKFLKINNSSYFRTLNRAAKV